MYSKGTQIPTVSIVKGFDRYNNIVRALDLLGSDAIFGTTHLLKPNFVSTKKQIASTHRDAVRAILDFLHKHSKNPVIIAEGAAVHDTFDGFRSFGFNDFTSLYDDIDFKDLNRDEYESFTLYDEASSPIEFRIAKTVLDSDHRISVSIPKTHDTAIVTLSLKNMAVGSLIRNMSNSFFGFFGCLVDKFVTYVPANVKPLFSFQGLSQIGLTKISGSDKIKLHKGYLNMHLFLYQLIRIIPPHLSILDGFTAMEGNGPVSGDRIDWRIAIAGTDCIAVDSVAAYLMGFDVDSIGYLHFCGQAKLGETNIRNINIIGNSVEECRRTFKPHRSYQAQLRWKERGERAFEKLTAVLEAKVA